jgi:hypothetical protein
MALPSSGAISFNAINVELGLSGTAQISLNDGAVRTLFGVASGAISMSDGYGKSSSVDVTVTLSANTTDYTLDTAQIPGYQAGNTNVTLVINSDVYVYATSTANAGLTIAALAAGDTVTIVNDGFIIGMGGGGQTGLQDAGGGGPAMSINRSVLITNNSYIAGGGGAGGGGQGGGGAGGGTGRGGVNSFNGGAGGGPGQTGSNGSGTFTATGGGGGGRILPGTGGAGTVSPVVSMTPGQGGGAGGGGGSYSYQGGFNFFVGGGGGGGGWGASGGSGKGGSSGFSGATGGAGGSGNGTGSNGNSEGEVTPAGAAGGKAVNLNGNTVTWLANGTRWGAIS